MTAKQIPARLPIGDPFNGVVFATPNTQGLAVEAAVVPSDVTVLHHGSMVIRYGIPYLGKPHLSVVPGLIALDYGDILNGEDAWSFVTKRSNLYPRAEVFGYRSDGRDEMVVVKNLDLALPFHVLVYAHDAATQPIARPTVLIADDDAAAALPARLLEIIPRVTMWGEVNHE